MIRLRHKFFTLFAAALSLVLCGCSHDDITDPGSAETTYLQIRVVAVGSGSPQSRAEGDGNTTGENQGGEGNTTGDEDKYRDPGSNELFNSLRIIIFNGNSQVEHNTLIQRQTAEALAEITQEFLVKARDMKKILLIGNEKSLSDDLQKAISEEMLPVGSSLPDDLLNAVVSFTLPPVAPDSGESGGSDDGNDDGGENDGSTADNPDGGGDEDAYVVPGNDVPLYDNGQIIPITEYYGFYVGEPLFDKDGNSKQYEATLFATRIATKFSIYLKLGDQYTTKQIAPDAVSISPVATSQYLFPHKTEYDPVKPYFDPFSSSSTENGLIDGTIRKIIQYEVPADAADGVFTTALRAPTRSDYNPDNAQYLATNIYLTETGKGIYQEGVSEKQEYTVTLYINGLALTATLPNLSSLPRNTHVVINMTLDKTATLNATVTLVPYTGVYLDPIFGIDRE